MRLALQLPSLAQATKEFLHVVPHLKAQSYVSETDGWRFLAKEQDIWRLLYIPMISYLADGECTIRFPICPITEKSSAVNSLAKMMQKHPVLASTHAQILMEDYFKLKRQKVVFVYCASRGSNDFQFQCSLDSKWQSTWIWDKRKEWAQKRLQEWHTMPIEKPFFQTNDANCKLHLPVDFVSCYISCK